ncbi:MAG TPA: antibiotic biosynthesis monooxygenase [Edaphocola sp.]|nr:antibiotic biosynthesis monooxygenase [Edaphocola sp.]
MLRVVKMIFQNEQIETFKSLFEERKTKIRGQQGCTHLELWQDNDNPQIFFTYSHWNHLEDLERYRKSDFFKDTWTQTKILFAAKAEAWSVNTVSRGGAVTTQE